MQIVHTLFIEIKSAQQREIKVEYTTWSKLVVVSFADYVFADGYTWLSVFHVDITSNKLGTFFIFFSLP
jgi:hypothetical protein